MQPDSESTGTFDPDRDTGLSVSVFAAGTVLAERYEIRRVIDRGGFGVVYSATDLVLGRDVALKVLRQDRSSANALARFRREVAIARDVASPHLVRIHDIESSDGATYLTMEYVDGESLRRRLENGPLPVQEVVRIAGQLFEALASLHAVGVIHRDVKPANILLGTNGMVKLGDFGLARGNAPIDGGATATGAILGTLSYVSPEQALGSPIDARSDLYSAGVVLYEMLTGRLPFEARSELGSVLARMKKHAPQVRHARPDCPRWLSGVVGRLLEMKPGDRYATAGEVLEDLRRRGSRLSRRRVRLGASLAAGIGGILLAIFAYRVATRPRFDHLAATGDRMVAVGTSGQRLWELGGIDLAIASHHRLLRRGHDGRRELAMFLIADRDAPLRETHALSFIDPETGRVTRRVALPSAANMFPRFAPRFAPDSLEAVDLDHDGAEEVIATFTHHPDWPSYTVLYEPTASRARVIFTGSGHHRVAGIADFDADGRDDVLLVGINNVLGWTNVAAAVRIVPPVNADFLRPAGAAMSPDFEPMPQSESALIWYAFLPREAEPHARIERGTIALRSADGALLRLGFDGLPPDNRGDHATRRRAILGAFRARREALRLIQGGFADRAIESADASVRMALDSRDPICVEAMSLSRAQLLIRAGRIEQAAHDLEVLWRASSRPGSLAFDAGEAFHLYGDLAQAVLWYGRAATPLGSVPDGHQPWEWMQGLVFAQCELGRWAEAMAAIDRYQSIIDVGDRDWSEMYRDFIRWRTGQPLLPATAGPPPNATDVLRYWDLEFAYARGATPATILARIDSRQAETSAVRGALLSLQAVTRMAAGQKNESRVAMQRALRFAEEDRRVSTFARAHYDVVRERYRRLIGEPK